MKTTLTREFYIPKGYIQYSPNLGDYPKDMFACYVTKDDSDPRAIFFVGKQSKPTWHFGFYTLSDMKHKINTTISNLMSNYERKVERKVALSQPSTLKVGDIMYASWGYDQTNVDFYQVIKTIGKRTVELRPISQSLDHTEVHSDYVLPVKDSFTGEAKKHIVKNGKDISLNSYSSAWLWDGRPKYQTALGYGH